MNEPRDRESSVAKPAVGQLWILPDLGDLPEQWLVLEAGDSGRLVRLVPADLDAQIGSGDIAVPEGSRWGALTLRGRHAVWVRAQALCNGVEIGVLEPEHVTAIRQRVAVLERGEAVGSILERETDTDPAYCAHAAALERACAALNPFELASVDSTVPSVPETAGRRSVPISPIRWATWLAAASLIFVLGLAVGRLGTVPPVAVKPLPWLVPEEILRGADSDRALWIEEGSSTYEVVLTLPFGFDAGLYEVTIREGERLVYRHTLELDGAAEVALQFSSKQFPPALYRLEIRAMKDASGGATAPTARYRLLVRERSG